jgi:hypothetical protein
MNDEKLGRALGTALAAPDVQARPDAGPLLRGRAARQRRERGLAGGSFVLVLGVLLAVGVVRGMGGGAPTTPAAGRPTGFSRLSTPLTVVAADPPASTCTAPPSGTRCGTAPLLTVDMITGLTTTDLPERDVAVTITLTSTDGALLSRLTSHPGYERIAVLVAGSTPLPATATGDRLRVTTDSTQTADRLVRALGPVALTAPRLGPGPLTRPLRVRVATAVPGVPCRLTSDGSGAVVLNRARSCLATRVPDINRGAGIVVRSGDLSVRAVAGDLWGVRIVPTADVGRLLPERASDIVFVYFVDGVPLQAAAGPDADPAHIDLLMPGGRDQADALAALLRS